MSDDLTIFFDDPRANDAVIAYKVLQRIRPRLWIAFMGLDGVEQVGEGGNILLSPLAKQNWSWLRTQACVVLAEPMRTGWARGK